MPEGRGLKPLPQLLPIRQVHRGTRNQRLWGGQRACARPVGCESNSGARERAGRFDEGRELADSPRSAPAYSTVFGLARASKLTPSAAKANSRRTGGRTAVAGAGVPATPSLPPLAPLWLQNPQRLKSAEILIYFFNYH